MRPRRCACLAGRAVVLLAGCATGTLATPESTPSASARSVVDGAVDPGPTVIVTVPDLLPTSASAAPAPGRHQRSRRAGANEAPTEARRGGTEEPAADPEEPADDGASDASQPRPSRPAVNRHPPRPRVRA